MFVQRSIRKREYKSFAVGLNMSLSLIIGFDSLYKCKTYILEVGVDDIKRIDTLREIRLIQGGLMDKPQCGNMSLRT